MRFWLVMLSFQKKSDWQNAVDFGEGGRTVLFVSHNTAAVKQLRRIVSENLKGLYFDKYRCRPSRII
jgi:hypothetical protein